MNCGWCRHWLLPFWGSLKGVHFEIFAAPLSFFLLFHESIIVQSFPCICSRVWAWDLAYLQHIIYIRHDSNLLLPRLVNYCQTGIHCSYFLVIFVIRLLFSPPFCLLHILPLPSLYSRILDEIFLLSIFGKKLRVCSAGKRLARTKLLNVSI